MALQVQSVHRGRKANKGQLDPRGPRVKQDQTVRSVRRVLKARLGRWAPQAHRGSPVNLDL